MPVQTFSNSEHGEKTKFALPCFQGYGYRPVYQGDATTFTCNGLQRITGYNFRLTATNEKGQSPSSPSVMYHTLPAIPGPPPAPFIKDRAASTSLHIAWQPPADNGGADIQTYIMQMCCTSQPDAELADVYTGPERSHLAEGLQPGKKYQSRVSHLSASKALIC